MAVHSPRLEEGESVINSLGCVDLRVEMYFRANGCLESRCFTREIGKKKIDGVSYSVRHSYIEKRVGYWERQSSAMGIGGRGCGAGTVACPRRGKFGAVSYFMEPMMSLLFSS